MQHDAGTHARTDVGGASGEVAELLAVGEGNFLFDEIIKPIDDFPALANGVSAVENLEA